MGILGAPPPPRRPAQPIVCAQTVQTLVSKKVKTTDRMILWHLELVRNINEIVTEILKSRPFSRVCRQRNHLYAQERTRELGRPVCSADVVVAAGSVRRARRGGAGGTSLASLGATLPKRPRASGYFKGLFCHGPLPIWACPRPAPLCRCHGAPRVVLFRSLWRSSILVTRRGRRPPISPRLFLLT